MQAGSIECRCKTHVLRMRIGTGVLAFLGVLYWQSWLLLGGLVLNIAVGRGVLVGREENR
jgi:hypothetical protein